MSVTRSRFAAAVFRILQVESDKTQNLSFLRHHDADAAWRFVFREIGWSLEIGTRIGSRRSSIHIIQS